MLTLDTQFSSTQHKYTQFNNDQHVVKLSHTFSMVKPRVIMLSAVYVFCGHYSQCRYAEFHFVKCHYAEYLHAEFPYAQSHQAECR
jgi:hypothetical protein